MSPNPPPTRRSASRRFAVLLAVVGLLLTATVIPGVFTVDEDNYLVTVHALRHGRLTVPGTDDLPPTRELAWFDPQAHSRRIDSTPVAPTAPPLYAPLALPFSFLGWRALVALNTVGFLLTALLVYLWTRRYGGEGETGDGRQAEATGWLAALAFLFAGYSVEYAQGLWPHMITVALTTSAAYLAFRLRDGAAPAWALLAGLCAGWAAGIRYQNVVLAALVGAGIFLFTRRRWVASLLYGAGAALPLAASSLINRARLGFWSPISKGPRYFTVSGEGAGGEAGGSVAGAVPGVVTETLTMLWVRVVDYTARPRLEGVASVFLSPHPESGVYVLGTAVKKAWLQSAPWLAPVLVALLLVWLWPRRSGAAAGLGEGGEDGGGAVYRGRLRELRSIGLVVFPVLGVFALAGASRTDGWSFNQRYFLELVPLAAVALGWIAAPAVRSWRRLGLGAAAGALLAAASLVRPPMAPVRHLAVSYLPLVLAALLLLVWLARSRHAAALAVAVGLALGWAGAIHLGDDLAASRNQRTTNQQRLAALAPGIPEGAAVFAFWGAKDSLGPLLLDRDVVVADPFADRGEAAPALVDAFLRAGRPVRVVLPFPTELLARMGGGRPVVRLSPVLAEIRPGPAGEGAENGPATARGPQERPSR